MTALTHDEVIASFDGNQHAAKGKMSNFDHSIDSGLAEELRADKYAVANYAAWDFHGEVFYRGNQFGCLVMRYHVFQKIVWADTLEELMEKCCEEFGND